MVAIGDKLGRPSIPSDYAIATTVKTTRVVSATVLECFDVSKFDPDTPAFFITYKKTTDPLTGVVTVTDQVSWKGLVNTGANTLTNLTVAPGYTDIGNDVGDFVELIPTSYWANSLIDLILTHSDQDGTLKAGAVDVAAVLASDVVTTAKILDSNVTTAKIADDAVTPEKRVDGFAIGTFTITATGSKVITGVGFLPKLVKFTFLPDTAATRATSAQGVMTASAQSASYSSTTATPSVHSGSATDKCIYLISAGGTNSILASKTSLDSDGFTINVATYSNIYGNTIQYEAFA